MATPKIKLQKEQIKALVLIVAFSLGSGSPKSPHFKTSFIPNVP
jgi:hypothetical protein